MYSMQYYVVLGTWWEDLHSLFTKGATGDNAGVLNAFIVMGKFRH